MLGKRKQRVSVGSNEVLITTVMAGVISASVAPSSGMKVGMKVVLAAAAAW